MDLIILNILSFPPVISNTIIFLCSFAITLLLSLLILGKAILKKKAKNLKEFIIKTLLIILTEFLLFILLTYSSASLQPDANEIAGAWLIIYFGTHILISTFIVSIVLIGYVCYLFKRKKKVE